MMHSGGASDSAGTTLPLFLGKASSGGGRPRCREDVVGYDLDVMQRGMPTAHVVEPKLPASTLLAGALVVRLHPSGQQPQEVAQAVEEDPDMFRGRLPVVGA